MIKTIHIDDNHSVELNGSMGWLFAYRAQFGRDITPDIMPMIEALVELALAGAGGIKEDTTMLDVLNNINEADVSEALATLSGMEMITMIDITWALAKNAHKDIPEPVEWVNQFDVFPIDEIMPVVIETIIESSMTSKNSQSLLKKMKKKKRRSTK